jgi:HlyD family secretion protein
MGMKLRLLIYISLASFSFFSCNPNARDFDASGTFEADETIVSSEVGGQIESLNIREGSVLAKDSVVGYIDSVPLQLQKAQAEATLDALHEKTVNVAPQVKLLNDQINVLEVQLENALNEKDRTERLIKADAATQKQLDDINTQIAVYRKQIAVNKQQIKVQESATNSQNRTVLSQEKPLKKSIAQIEDQLKRAIIKNPVKGTVLTKYAMAGEYTPPGKALYSIGDLSVITLRVYVTGNQFAQIKLNQPVKVFVDSTEKSYREYPGVITWISDKAEFTPKTIQTKDERANLVYAVKIQVKNDGLLKIGMYGQVKFN